MRNPATAGNPFYLTALLVAETSGVPPSVRDAVRAALARLPAATRVLAEWVSLFPGRVERGLLERLAVPPAPPPPLARMAPSSTGPHGPSRSLRWPFGRSR